MHLFKPCKCSVLYVRLKMFPPGASRGVKIDSGAQSNYNSTSFKGALPLPSPTYYSRQMDIFDRAKRSISIIAWNAQRAEGGVFRYGKNPRGLADSKSR